VPSADIVMPGLGDYHGRRRRQPKRQLSPGPNAIGPIQWHPMRILLTRVRHEHVWVKLQEILNIWGILSLFVVFKTA
jgi:hypothetical protein